MTTVHLIQAFPDLRETLRRRFRHVLVDEYQDTNHAQYALVRELCGEDDEDSEAGGADGRAISAPELMVVGDSDQSIYAFRGATIRNINDFETDFPGASVIMLEQNYRSTQTILSAANAVIRLNPARKPKNLWSDAGDGPLIQGYVADTEHDEAQFVAGEIAKLRDAGEGRLGDAAVFYRTNAQSRTFEEVFIRAGPGVQGRRRGALLRAARGPRRDRLPARDQQPRRRRLGAPDPQRAQAGHRRQGRGRGVGRWRRGSGISFGEALRRVDDIPGWRPGRPTRSAASPRSSTPTRRWSPRAPRPTRS